MRLPLTYGLHQGRLLSIREVPSGLACGCACPACGARLQARKGRTKTHHFAHHRVPDCPGALETMLHRLAKQVIAEAGRLRLPAVYIHRAERPLQGESWWRFERAEVEATVKGLRCDLLLHKGSEALAVEIAVTHPLTAARQRRFVQLGLSCLEIDAGAIYQELAALGRADDEEQLRAAIVEAARHRQWAFHLQQHRAEYAIRQRADHRRVHRRLFRGYHQYLVYDCPLTTRRIQEGFRHGRTYARVWQDCAHCPYCLAIDFDTKWVAFKETPQLPEKVVCWAGQAFR